MQRLSRLEEEEKNYIETRKRKFFAEVLNAVREFQLQIQNTMKRRRQRNDGIMVCYVSFLYLFIFTFYAYLKWDKNIVGKVWRNILKRRVEKEKKRKQTNMVSRKQASHWSQELLQ